MNKTRLARLRKKLIKERTHGRMSISEFANFVLDTLLTMMDMFAAIERRNHK